MDGYLVRQVKHGSWEVTKWGDAREPLAVYQVKKGTKHWHCSASYACKKKDKCKHAQLVSKWLLKEYPAEEMPEFMLDIDAQLIKA